MCVIAPSMVDPCKVKPKYIKAVCCFYPNSNKGQEKTYQAHAVISMLKQRGYNVMDLCPRLMLK